MEKAPPAGASGAFEENRLRSNQPYDEQAIRPMFLRRDRSALRGFYSLQDSRVTFMSAANPFNAACTARMAVAASVACFSTLLMRNS